MALIGKNVIENLTTAMYDNPLDIYREYIQNSCDSIDKAVHKGVITKDEATIDIKIDSAARKIIIYDNAFGLCKEDFREILTTIADSKKDATKEKGFRGIGRLVGLAYCDKMIFKSSIMGENTQSLIEWDGKKLREVLSNMYEHPNASDLIDNITNYSTNKCSKEEHFFEVLMEGVTQESNELLNESKVIEYIEEVLPAPYINSFLFRAKIYDFAKENNITIDEYNIIVNGNNVYKPYTTVIYESMGNGSIKREHDKIIDIVFKKFFVGKKFVAWLWYGVSSFDGQIKSINKMRAIRIRKENIEIGNEQTLSNKGMFKESKSNTYFVGELFVLDKEIRPNARRDYFNQNKALRDFENCIKPFFYEELCSLYRYANDVKKPFDHIKEAREKENEYNEKVSNNTFIDSEDKDNEKHLLERAQKDAKIALHKLELRKKDAQINEVKGKIYSAIQNKYNSKITEERIIEKPIDLLQQKKYLVQELSNLSDNERKLVSKIYKIIKSVFPDDTANDLIKKINSELQK